MSHKYIISLAVLVITLLTISTEPTNGAVASYESHNLIIGTRMPGDKLVLQENVVKNSGWLKVQVVEKTFTAPKGERITVVEALDQKTNGKGAYASVLNGGPGQNFVTMKFKSQRGHSIKFVLKLYARP
ncbi:probable salivary secreted peptide [Monomorium pharaonis]|uniref:probable salivary secreted peptide n=1 Tax=Monomorium pharaonis TaxID=307658 RepID=UPI001746F5ED|nr:probable salivary secreted peptide [Monomorium pharaonis]